MKEFIKREELKNNFLKRIIMRCDFSGVSENEIDGLIIELKQIFSEHGFDEFKESYSTEMDFQLDDPEDIRKNGIPVKDIRKQKVWIFINNKKSIIFKLSTMFAFVLIENNKYVDFSEYNTIFSKVMKKVKSKISFFKCFRIGIRKINQCILLNPSLLNEYFEKKYFQFFKFKEDDNQIDNNLYEVKDCFRYYKYNINLLRNIIQGELNTKEAYQVVLDTDIYLTDEEKIDGFFKSNDENLKEMNDILFEIYKDSITFEFIKKLEKDKFNDEELVGVEKNE